MIVNKITSSFHAKTHLVKVLKHIQSLISGKCCTLRWCNFPRIIKKIVQVSKHSKLQTWKSSWMLLSSKYDWEPWLVQKLSLKSLHIHICLHILFWRFYTGFTGKSWRNPAKIVHIHGNSPFAMWNSVEHKLWASKPLESFSISGKLHVKLKLFWFDFAYFSATFLKIS